MRECADDAAHKEFCGNQDWCRAETVGLCRVVDGDKNDMGVLKADMAITSLSPSGQSKKGLSTLLRIFTDDLTDWEDTSVYLPEYSKTTLGL